MKASSYLDTPLGKMLAVSNETALYLLEFVDACGLDRENGKTPDADTLYHSHRKERSDC